MTQLTRKEADRDFAVSAFTSFMTLFGNAQQLLKTRMQQEAEQGLGPLHLRALCLCQQNPGGTQQALVQSLLRDKGQIARLIRELEERALLVRTPDESDRRVWRLTVTAQGEAKCYWFSSLEAEVAQALFAGMDADGREQTQRLLAELGHRFDMAAGDMQG